METYFFSLKIKERNRFNYAVVLEVCGKLKEAKEQYEKAVDLGIERANQNLRNVNAKLVK